MAGLATAMFFPLIHNEVQNTIGEIAVSGTISAQYFGGLDCGRILIRSKHFDVVQQARSSHDIRSATLPHLHDATRIIA